MKKAFISLLSVWLFLTGSVCNAQTFEVSDPALSLIDNTVHITYNILNSSRSDNFIISMTITDPDGRIIEANALSGDIGEGVSGGGEKVIKWDLVADGIVMNSTIYVKIRAKLIPPPKADVPLREEPVVVLEPEEKPAASVGSKSINRGSVMLQSIALPGLGLTRVTGKPHWIKGVVGYGCIAGSVILNRKAINSYKGIYDLTEYNDKDELFQESIRQDNISETLAYVAIGIWVAELVWTWIGTNDLNEKPFLGDLKGLTLETSMDPLMRTPMIGVGYRF